MLQLRDPAEDRLRGVGFVRAREAETGRPFVIRGRLRGMDPTHAQRQLKRAGVDYLLIPTDQPFVSQRPPVFQAPQFDRQRSSLTMTTNRLRASMGHRDCS